MKVGWKRWASAQRNLVAIQRGFQLCWLAGAKARLVQHTVVIGLKPGASTVRLTHPIYDDTFTLRLFAVTRRGRVSLPDGHVLHPHPAIGALLEPCIGLIVKIFGQ